MFLYICVFIFYWCITNVWWSGDRSAVQLASCAVLASAAASLDLINHILPAQLQSLPTPYVDIALATWSNGHDSPPPFRYCGMPSESLGHTQGDQAG